MGLRSLPSFTSCCCSSPEDEKAIYYLFYNACRISSLSADGRVGGKTQGRGVQERLVPVEPRILITLPPPPSLLVPSTNSFRLPAKPCLHPSTGETEGSKLGNSARTTKLGRSRSGSQAWPCLQSLNVSLPFRPAGQGQPALPYLVLFARLLLAQEFCSSEKL